MRTQRIITLVIGFLVIVCVVSSIVLWENRTVNLPDISVAEEMEKEIQALNKRLEELIRLADGMGQLSSPTNGVTSSVHKKYPKKNYEDADIQDIDKEKGLVLVTTKESKISIIFKPAPENLKKFRVGSIAPVTFQCTKEKKGKCDFVAPYKLFISNSLVEPKRLIFPIQLRGGGVFNF